MPPPDRPLPGSKNPAIIQVMPGDCLISKGDKTLSTLLGSCVSACIYDWVKGIGGMNHFMLPVQGSLDPTRASTDKSARYGDFAMELLINRCMTQGADRKHLVAKVFGGAAVLGGVSSQIGIRNAEFALSYLQIEGIKVLAVDLGGQSARKIDFHPRNGRVELRHIRASHALLSREIDYAQKVQDDDPAGPVIFF